jgi:hypothetical protein
VGARALRGDIHVCDPFWEERFWDVWRHGEGARHKRKRGYSGGRREEASAPQVAIATSVIVDSSNISSR